MKFWRKHNKIEINIEFDKETEEIKIIVNPVTIRPVEILQTLMLAINTINTALQDAIEEDKEHKKPKQKLQSYVI